MSGPIVSVTDLRRRLAAAGHATWSPPDGGRGGRDPRVTPDTIVTVAVDPDGFLPPAWRNRYFACVRDPDKSLRARRDPTLVQPPVFDRVISDPDANEFVAGPVRWLLTRLVRFPHILLWPDRQNQSVGNNGLVSTKTLVELPELHAHVERLPEEIWPIGALVLDLNRDGDAACFWEAACLVGRSVENFYVSNEDTTEVYVMHHHDKVVVMVPDQYTRWLLLEEVADLSDVFEDWSGYHGPLDDDDEEPTDTDADQD